MINRRGILTGLSGLILAPAVVRAESLMKISVPMLRYPYTIRIAHNECIGGYHNQSGTFEAHTLNAALRMMTAKTKNLQTIYEGSCVSMTSIVYNPYREGAPRRFAMRGFDQSGNVLGDN